jgi:hypothetical protein
MKTSMMALAFAAFATTGLAHASETTVIGNQPGAGQLQQWEPVQPGAAQKTRAKVRLELLHAEQDGQLVYLRKLYRGS